MMVKMTKLQVTPERLRYNSTKSVKSLALRIFLSAFIVFHLSVIIILANGGSYLGRSLQASLLPYANTLGLNATWNFFSPDPAHTMFYRYKIYFESPVGEELKESIEGFFPPEKTHIVIDSSKRRLLYSMRFLTIDPSRIKSLMAPWLCKQYPGASRVRMEYIVNQIPLLDVAVARKDDPMDDLVSEKNLINNEVSCTQGADEVSL